LRKERPGPSKLWLTFFITLCTSFESLRQPVFTHLTRLSAIVRTSKICIVDQTLLEVTQVTKAVTTDSIGVNPMLDLGNHSPLVRVLAPPHQRYSRQAFTTQACDKAPPTIGTVEISPLKQRPDTRYEMSYCSKTGAAKPVASRTTQPR
jgi:hypothetical protein